MPAVVMSFLLIVARPIISMLWTAMKDVAITFGVNQKSLVGDINPVLNAVVSSDGGGAVLAK